MKLNRHGIQLLKAGVDMEIAIGHLADVGEILGEEDPFPAAHLVPAVEAVALGHLSDDGELVGEIDVIGIVAIQGLAALQHELPLGGVDGQVVSVLKDGEDGAFPRGDGEDHVGLIVQEDALAVYHLIPAHEAGIGGGDRLQGHVIGHGQLNVQHAVHVLSVGDEGAIALHAELDVVDALEAGLYGDVLVALCKADGLIGDEQGLLIPVHLIPALEAVAGSGHGGEGVGAGLGVGILKAGEGTAKALHLENALCLVAGDGGHVALEIRLEDGNKVIGLLGHDQQNGSARGGHRLVGLAVSTNGVQTHEAIALVGHGRDLELRVGGELAGIGIRQGRAVHRNTPALGGADGQGEDGSEYGYQSGVMVDVVQSDGIGGIHRKDVLGALHRPVVEFVALDGYGGEGGGGSLAFHIVVCECAVHALYLDVALGLILHLDGHGKDLLKDRHDDAIGFGHDEVGVGDIVQEGVLTVLALVPALEGIALGGGGGDRKQFPCLEDDRITVLHGISAQGHVTLTLNEEGAGIGLHKGAEQGAVDLAVVHLNGRLVGVAGLVAVRVDLVPPVKHAALGGNGGEGDGGQGGGVPLLFGQLLAVNGEEAHFGLGGENVQQVGLLKYRHQNRLAGGYGEGDLTLIVKEGQLAVCLLKPALEGIALGGGGGEGDGIGGGQLLGESLLHGIAVESDGTRALDPYRDGVGSGGGRLFGGSLSISGVGRLLRLGGVDGLNGCGVGVDRGLGRIAGDHCQKKDKGQQCDGQKSLLHGNLLCFYSRG